MTDQRADDRVETTLDARVAEALRSGEGTPSAEPRARRFGVRAEQEQARDRRAEQHELRLDALTNRLSGLALRTAALQASQDGALAAREDAAARCQEVTGRLDSVVIEQMEAAAAQELTVKLVRSLAAQVDELTEAVATLTTKTRSQAGQLTKLRNQLKDLAAPAAAADTSPTPRRTTRPRKA